MASSSPASIDPARLQSEIFAVGRSITAAQDSHAGGPLRGLDEAAIGLSTRDHELRAALFRLVDVTPACRNLDDLGSHLGSLLEEVQDRPVPLGVATRMAHTKAGRMALGAAVASSVRHLAHRFIAGESPAAALGKLSKLWSTGIGSSVDLLGEATVTGAEADHYAERCEDALGELARGCAAWPERTVLERDSAGAIPRVNLSVKVSALTPLVRPEAPALGRDDAVRRLRPLLRRARELGAHMHVDTESLDSLETTREVVLGLLGEEEFRDGPSAGIVLQAYLRESPAELDRILAWAESSGRRSPLVVRLVKGAYWDHESVEAQQHGWRIPVLTDKAKCDRNFESLTRRLLEARPLVRVAIASHNLRSVSHAIALNRLRGGYDHDLELQVLRGLGDELAWSLADAGFRVRVYSPVGDLVAGMAYLVRRLLENTSNESFHSEQYGGAPLEELLVTP